LLGLKSLWTKASQLIALFISYGGVIHVQTWKILPLPLRDGVILLQLPEFILSFFIIINTKMFVLLWDSSEVKKR